MKGKHLVIGLIVFIIAVVGTIWFFVNAEFEKGPNKTQVETIID